MMDNKKQEMKILFVYELADTEDIVSALRRSGYEAESYQDNQKGSYPVDNDKVDRLVDIIEKRGITHLLSIGLLYDLAVAACRTGSKYIVLIWDAPYLRMMSPYGRVDNCWFSVFDRLDLRRFQEAGIRHVLYQPLSVNRERVLEWNRNAHKILRGKHIHDISFVGSLYENNLYDEHLHQIPVQMQNYFNSIFEEAAFCWDGKNRIYGKTTREILDYIKLVSPDFQIFNRLDIDDVQMFEIMFLVRKIANIERIAILNILSEEYDVTLYTTSMSEKDKLGKTKVRPPVLPGKDATVVYAGSKINLNISLKGIEGGTPQRIIDVLGAGGFMLTNYCGETADLFQEDKELVMFRTPEELVEKIDYYLSHDEERKKIAKAGQEKVLRSFTYEKKFRQLMEWIETSYKEEQRQEEKDGCR